MIGKVLETSAGQNLLEILAGALREVMEAEVSAVCNAEYGERTGERDNQRNGYRLRPFETRLGTVELEIPRLRRSSYLPSFLESRKRWEQAFVQVVAEAYVRGVSTRKVEALVEAMGAKGMSKSEVSRLAKVLDDQVCDFRTRPLTKKCPYIWVDALYIKVRERSHVVSKAVLVAYAVGEDGGREVLDLDVASGEMEVAWRAFFQRLVGRGLHGVRLVVSDAHSGLRGAIRTVFVGATWQRCTIHFRKDILAHVPKSAQEFVKAAVRSVFQQADKPAAREAMTRAIELVDKRYPKVAELLRDAEEDVLAFMDFPKAHWRQIHSTNPLERINKEIRRRTNVVGIFPNDAALVRLVAMLLIEQNDEWAVARRYFSIGSMAQIDADSRAPAHPEMEVAT
jgi:transposase-like protein